MLVFCCGMMRSGSTLQYQLAAEIVESSGLGNRMGWVDSGNIQKIKNHYLNQEMFHIVKCHNYLDESTEIFLNGEAKAIYVYRDIRDVVVSLMNKFNLSYYEIVKRGFIETIVKAYYDWTRLENTLISRYETMIENIAQEARRIAEYLGIEISEATAKRLDQKYSLNNQIQRIRQFDYQKGGVNLRSGEILDPKTLLHANHIFSGKSGQYKTELSRIQISLIESKAYRSLVEVDYPISQPWILRMAVSMAFPLYNHARRIIRFAGREITKLRTKNVHKPIE